MNNKVLNLLSVLESVTILVLIILCSTILVLKIHNMQQISSDLGENREYIRQDLKEAVELRELVKGLIDKREQQHSVIERKLDEVIRLLKKRDAYSQ